MDWSIQEIARLSGTTSRTLRHYDKIGLLPPSRVGDNGYRYYNEESLTRLQRILLLRELGLGLSAIAEVIAGQPDTTHALVAHLGCLREEQQRLARQVRAVETTINKMNAKEQLMAEESLDGFDHTQYRQEVEQRWGAQAYAASDAWWRSKSAQEKSEWQAIQKQLASEWADAAARGVDPASAEAQALAARHFDWLGGIPSTPSTSRASGTEAGGPTKDYFASLGDMYVADPRFAKNYGGQAGAEFVRDAMRAYAELNL